MVFVLGGGGSRGACSVGVLKALLERGVIRRLYGLVRVQQFVVGAVAALGVVTALLISVLQRRRELGLLRSVGATRGQVLRSSLALPQR